MTDILQKTLSQYGDALRKKHLEFSSQVDGVAYISVSTENENVEFGFMPFDQYPESHPLWTLPNGGKAKVLGFIKAMKNTGRIPALVIIDNSHLFLVDLTVDGIVTNLAMGIVKD